MNLFSSSCFISLATKLQYFINLQFNYNKCTPDWQFLLITPKKELGLVMGDLEVGGFPHLPKIIAKNSSVTKRGVLEGEGWGIRQRSKADTGTLQHVPKHMFYHPFFTFPKHNTCEPCKIYGVQLKFDIDRAQSWEGIDCSTYPAACELLTVTTR